MSEVRGGDWPTKTEHKLLLLIEKNKKFGFKEIQAWLSFEGLELSPVVLENNKGVFAFSICRHECSEIPKDSVKALTPGYKQENLVLEVSNKDEFKNRILSIIEYTEAHFRINVVPPHKKVLNLYFKKPDTSTPYDFDFYLRCIFELEEPTLDLTDINIETAKKICDDQMFIGTITECGGNCLSIAMGRRTCLSETRYCCFFSKGKDGKERLIARMEGLCPGCEYYIEEDYRFFILLKHLKGKIAIAYNDQRELFVPKFPTQYCLAVPISTKDRDPIVFPLTDLVRRDEEVVLDLSKWIVNRGRKKNNLPPMEQPQFILLGN
ncbi:MAG: hypothetical protein ACOX3T_04075 [Bdellovibrionota bacterium]|jgi:hypothetical protein